ncbi:hypothetical protein HDV00_005989 [Rhizophlyctis rosea]|nr:hypothetical protein HDV00_005989 [Rhizophlyctis rosea]
MATMWSTPFRTQYPDKCIIHDINQDNQINSHISCVMNGRMDVAKKQTATIDTAAVIEAAQKATNLTSNTSKSDTCNYVNNNLSWNQYIEAMNSCTNKVNNDQANEIIGCLPSYNVSQSNKAVPTQAARGATKPLFKVIPLPPCPSPQSPKFRKSPKYDQAKTAHDPQWNTWKAEDDALSKCADDLQVLQTFKECIKYTDGYRTNGKRGKANICKAGLNWSCDIGAFCDQYAIKPTDLDKAFSSVPAGNSSAECYSADSEWFWRKGRCKPDPVAVQAAIDAITNVQLPAKRASEPQLHPPSPLNVSPGSDK